MRSRLGLIPKVVAGGPGAGVAGAGQPGAEEAGGLGAEAEGCQPDIITLFIYFVLFVL